MTGERGLLRLYVTGSGPRAEAAASAVRTLALEAPGAPYDVEIVDVAGAAASARAAGVILTPALVKVRPGPERRWTGDLTRVERMLALLDEP